MNETITYANLINLIIGFTIGRVLGIMFFNRLNRRK